jgi:IS5 family transposase
MRIKSQKQLYIKPQSKSVPGASQLKLIERSLESLPGYNSILDKVSLDLNPKNPKGNQGRKGMTAEQVLRALIVKQLNNYSYRKLADSISDSISVMEFLNLSPFSKGFHYKTLQSNIKLIEEDTLDMINSEIKSFALSCGIEDGKAIRTDGFNTESNIHYPTDWSLMNDSIRVLSRTLCCALEDLKVPVKFTNHYRASKKKLFKINNDNSSKKRKKLNMELIRLTKKTLSYAKQSLPVMQEFDGCATMEEYMYLASLIADLKHFMPLVENVIDQAHRRIVQGEKVPSEEKIVSLFEEHTDIISKGSRNIIFGHKNTITTGKSGLVLNIDIHDGNPADSTLVKKVIENHKQFYGAVPKSAVFDGCYSSNDNREFAKNEGIKQTCFSKETNKQSSVSRFIRKKLRNFRAGIEASVSMLMRMFGLTRIMNKGLRSFRNTAKAAVVTYNLFILSRAQLK